MKVVGRRLQKKGEWLHHEGCRKKAAEKRKNGCIMKVVGRRLQKKEEWLHHEGCWKKAAEKGRMAAS